MPEPIFPSRTSRTTSRAKKSVSAKEPEAFTDTLPEFGSGVVPQPKKNVSPFVRGGIIVAVIIVLGGLLGYFSTQIPRFGTKASRNNAYYAVFLNTGQSFFGTIEREDRENILLSNVFYMQLVDQQLPPLEEGGEPRVVQQPQLVKKGDEFYGPDSSIRINRGQVTYIERLREDSQILTQIQARLSAQ